VEALRLTTPRSYEAFWVPGLTDDIDRDVSLAHGFRWLVGAERKYGKKGIVIMYAKSMVGNAPLLGQAAARWEFVSPRSHGAYRSGGPVLAIWPPNDRTMELAESCAFGSALCVIPGSSYEIAPWVRRTGARCLMKGFEVEVPTQLPQEITNALDSVLSIGGHNGFLGGGEKEIVIRGLRRIATRRDSPTRKAIEEYLRASGQTDGRGAERAASWYAEIQDGKRHRDYRGRTIK
jgi:hypothetical protein